MKFSQMEYQRPDLERLVKGYQAITEEFLKCGVSCVMKR